MFCNHGLAAQEKFAQEKFEDILPKRSFSTWCQLFWDLIGDGRQYFNSMSTSTRILCQSMLFFFFFSNQFLLPAFFSKWNTVLLSVGILIRFVKCWNTVLLSAILLFLIYTIHWERGWCGSISSQISKFYAIWNLISA